ncbi:MAG: hypothetical protein WB626_02920 [Bacteroidota bacterium]
MTDNTTIWRALQQHCPKRTWIPLIDILATVRARVPLDDEDRTHSGSSRSAPLWERNVRRLLRMKAQSGSIRSRPALRDSP